MKGQESLYTNNSDLNVQDFLIQQMLNGINTAEPVTVASVNPPEDELHPVGSVCVNPLVNLVDGEGKGHKQSQLFNLPYFRVIGGENAFICDPKPGDVGLAVYAMRDTEAVKADKGQNASNPGSARVMNKGDGFYLGGFITGVTPKRYVMVNDKGITIDDGEGGKIELKSGKLTINAPAGIETHSIYFHGYTPDFIMGGEGGAATINADMRLNGSLTSTDDQIAGGISQINHTHTDVEPGGGNTGKPQ